MQLQDFITYLIQEPAMLLITILMMIVMMVNGWTDAPNAIATCVSTRSMSAKKALVMAVLCNFAGVFVISSFNTTVAETIYGMVDFGTNAHEALLTLCAALISIIVWALAAWKFGIPTSESHALIAGLSGAAIALHHGLSGINGEAWGKVLIGLVLCLFLGFAAGWLMVRIIEAIFRRFDRRKTRPFFRYGSVFGGAAMAFMHGAQDGQKFMGVFLLGLFMAHGSDTSAALHLPLWLMILCSLMMGLGTSIGGYRIIRSVGMNMVRLEKYQGFSADTAASLCLLGFSLTGIPVSTTQTKLTSAMGVGAARRLSSVDWGFVRQMILTWILTFPGAGAIGFLMTELFLLIF